MPCHTGTLQQQLQMQVQPHRQITISPESSSHVQPFTGAVNNTLITAPQHYKLYTCQTTPQLCREVCRPSLHCNAT